MVAANGLWLSHKPKDYFNVTWRREAGGGPILINAIHDIDCLRMLCGDVETVSAGASRATRNFEVEDTAAAVLHFKSGALGTLLVSDAVSAPWSWEWGSRENPNRPHDTENCYIVAGTKGSITVPSLQHRWHEAGQESWDNPLTQVRLKVTPADAYHEQMRNFADVIRGTEAPVLSGRGGTITLATTLAITRSAQTGAPVRVADMMARLRAMTLMVTGATGHVGRRDLAPGGAARHGGDCGLARRTVQRRATIGVTLAAARSHRRERRARSSPRNIEIDACIHAAAISNEAYARPDPARRDHHQCRRRPRTCWRPRGSAAWRRFVLVSTGSVFRCVSDCDEADPRGPGNRAAERLLDDQASPPRC